MTRQELGLRKSKHYNEREIAKQEKKPYKQMMNRLRKSKGLPLKPEYQP
jgi:hypothetical protein